MASIRDDGGRSLECEEELDTFDDPLCPLDKKSAEESRTDPLRWKEAASAPLTALWAQIRTSASAAVSTTAPSTVAKSEKRPLSATGGVRSEGVRSSEKENEDDGGDESWGTECRQDAGALLSALPTPQSLLGGWAQARREASPYALTPGVDIPTPSESISPVLALAAGKYFGVEKFVSEEYQRLRRPGSIKSACVGFASPDLDNPVKSFRLSEVVRGKDEHGEDNGSLGYVQVLRVELADPPAAHLVDLLRFFFEFHDPTSRDAQGRDRGYQYGSYILCDDEEQEDIARVVKAELQGLINSGAVKCFDGKDVLTEVGRLGDFFPAPEEHQDFVNKNHYIGWHGLNTSNHFIRRNVWPTHKGSSRRAADQCLSEQSLFSSAASDLSNTLIDSRIEEGGS